MAAPKGNRFWELRSKHGRDVLFSDAKLLWEAACEYFQWCEENPFTEVEQKKGNTMIPRGTELTPESINMILGATVEMPKMRPFTIYGLCSYLHCHTKYFNEIKESEKYKNDKDFSDVITCIEETIYNQKFSGAAAGFLESKIITSDLGLAQKKEVEMQKRVIRLLDPEDEESE